MQSTRRCSAVALLAMLVMSGTVSAESTRLFANPAVSQSHIAFVFDRDLWVADRDGKSPRRLTSHEGVEFSPRFSPDGKSIAFSAQYDGNLDVYIMPIRGGVPRRLTFHPDIDVVEGFTNDGKAVLFSSTRNTFTRRHRKLFTVSVAGGFPTQLPIPHGQNASYSPDGKRIAYTPLGERFGQWKNYRGGTTSRIWIYDAADHSVQQVRQPPGRCNDTDPVFVDDRIYFRSDRNGEFNIYCFDPRTEAVEQLTRYDDFPVNRVTEGQGTLIYEQAGYLHLLDTRSKKSRRIPLKVATDATELRPRLASGGKWIRAATISPSGARAAFEFRGEIVTVPAKKGDVRNLTQSPGAHERSPAWSPDGKSIAYFSDAGGEYQLHIAPRDGKGKVSRHAVQGHGFYFRPKWSPDGKRISYVDNSKSLYIYNIADKQTQRVGGEPKYGPDRFDGLAHNWSPDSQWVAYTVNTDAMIQRVFVFHVESGKSTPITDGMSEVSEPVFDRSGKYLYFIASTDAGPVKHWFAMSNADMEISNSIYVAVLQEEAENPLARESDEETGDSPKETEDESNSGEKPSDAAPKDDGVEIDFEGLDQRILALPMRPAVYSNLQAGAAGELFYVKRNRDGDRALVSFSMKKRAETELLKNAASFELSSNGKKLLYTTGEQWGIADAGPKISDGKLAVDSIQVRIDPMAEWRQIFDEVWRINRDYFYDPNMHGADWPAMKKKYEPLLKHCVTRDDLNRVLMWMCSELAVGHHRVGGGDVRPDVDSVPGGLLGADFVLHKGRYRVEKVLGGLNWNGAMRAPLTEPGVRVKAGEYILSIDGVDLKSGDNIHRHLENKAGKRVELKVGPQPNGKASRNVIAVPVSSEAALRNRDWVEGNLRRVHEATNGRVAYVYVPNTTGSGHSYFKRYFFPQTDKDAIIVDERFNGGGQIADYYIDHLRRPYISHWATRYGKDLVTPTGAIFGPKVMLIDETAGSGGDLLPWMFRKLEVGTLVGKRTWGGLVGILGFPQLMDGGTVTAPNIAIWTEDGFVVENVGVKPDVEVEQYPADVIAGRDPQLEKAIQVILKQLEAESAEAAPQTPIPDPRSTVGITRPTSDCFSENSLRYWRPSCGPSSPIPFFFSEARTIAPTFSASRSLAVVAAFALASRRVRRGPWGR